MKGVVQVVQEAAQESVGAGKGRGKRGRGRDVEREGFERGMWARGEMG